MSVNLYSPDCDCPCAGSGHVAESGGAALSRTYALLISAGCGDTLLHPVLVDVVFDAFVRKDEMIIDIDGGIVFNSGCIDGSASPSFTAPVGSRYLNVTIIPECDPLQTTPPNAWQFTIDWAEIRCA